MIRMTGVFKFSKKKKKMQERKNNGGKISMEKHLEPVQK